MKLLITGGCGFIGSNFILERIRQGDQVLNLDKLTYSGNPENLNSVEGNSNYFFAKGDIGDKTLVRRLLTSFHPDAIVNFAAESHVDRSLSEPAIFLRTNVLGTESLLEESLSFWMSLEHSEKSGFRFLHVSTDEVYGSLSFNEPPFTEQSPYRPNSPYSASKASSDHFVRAFHETYGLPTLITNCSNNYGPRQYPEKLIPLMILNALSGKELPVYGNGLNVRDWLHVYDHCDALTHVLRKANPGETFNIGGNCEKSNLQVLDTLLAILDEIEPRKDGISYKSQIKFVKDRPGHDLRYAIDASKIKRDLGWSPRIEFEGGIRETIFWYLENKEWVENVTAKNFQEWIKKNYEERN